LPSLYKVKEGSPEIAIVCRMPVIASSSGVAVISVAVLASVLAIWWLLRLEARDDEAEKAEEQAARERGGPDGLGPL
jgi:hypothetical protein